MWKNKKVLVTGSEGMIGKELVIQLEELGIKVYRTDLSYGHDLRHYNTCFNVVRVDGLEKIDYIFHLAGIKGNPKMTKERPVDFIGPMLQFDTNMILEAQKAGIKRFLYTSSIAVENPETDKYPAWAKKTAETLIEAMRIQYPKGTKYCIVRPSNVYGRFDNFDNPNAMVVTNLINKALKQKELVIDITGEKQTRDFINAKDVAKGMIKVMENMQDYPVNLCSGINTNIGHIVDIIMNQTNIPVKRIDMQITLGPDVKTMKLNWDFQPEISLEEGIKEVIEYARNM